MKLWLMSRVSRKREEKNGVEWQNLAGDIRNVLCGFVNLNQEPEMMFWLKF